MSISYGGDKITASDGGSLNPLSAIFRNRLIDAGFIINQRGYTSGTALSASAYAHDRWKAGAGGATYTFTQGSTGVPIVITITAGSLQQVIEGCNMPEGGTYVLSWTGTAQARFNGGTYGSSPLSVTGITAGANTTIEFNTGTVSFPQLEVGSSATGYEYRQYQQELALCQRYLPAFINTGIFGTIGSFGSAGSTTQATINVPFPVATRVPPTGVSTSGTFGIADNASGFNASSLTFNGQATTLNAGLNGNTATAVLTTFRPYSIYANSANSQLLFTGCEL